MWNKVKPLYRQLHAYVSFKQKEKYKNILSETGSLPAHLLGDMWAQTWDSISNIVLSFPDRNSPDITEDLNKQG